MAIFFLLYFAFIIFIIAAVWKTFERPGNRDGHVLFLFTAFM
jgi:hypothetical protein